MAATVTVTATTEVTFDEVRRRFSVAHPSPRTPALLELPKTVNEIAGNELLAGKVEETIATTKKSDADCAARLLRRFRWR